MKPLYTSTEHPIDCVTFTHRKSIMLGKMAQNIEEINTLKKQFFSSINLCLRTLLSFNLDEGWQIEGNNGVVNFSPKLHPNLKFILKIEGKVSSNPLEYFNNFEISYPQLEYTEPIYLDYLSQVGKLCTFLNQNQQRLLIELNNQYSNYISNYNSLKEKNLLEEENLEINKKTVRDHIIKSIRHHLKDSKEIIFKKSYWGVYPPIITNRRDIYPNIYKIEILSFSKKTSSLILYTTEKHKTFSIEIPTEDLMLNLIKHFSLLQNIHL